MLFAAGCNNHEFVSACYKSLVSLVEGVCKVRGLDFELLPGIGQNRPTRKGLQKKEGTYYRRSAAQSHA